MRSTDRRVSWRQREQSKISEISDNMAGVIELKLPSEYGWVVLAVGVGTFVVTTMMGGPVMHCLLYTSDAADE